MSTECIQKSFEFHPHFQRKVESDFAGGQITSHGGGIFLREGNDWRGVSATDAIPNGLNMMCRRWFLSEYTVLLWATRI